MYQQGYQEASETVVATDNDEFAKRIDALKDEPDVFQSRRSFRKAEGRLLLGAIARGCLLGL